MTTKTKVLFVCVHNSGRSQMAQAFLEQMAGDRFEVASAGFEPMPINPLVVEVMAEVGIDLSQRGSQGVFDLYKRGQLYDYVITVCDDSRESQCPIFPGVTHRLHWPFPDPAAVQGDQAEKLAAVRAIRDQVRARIAAWLEHMGEP
ncbi:MAG: arsenate reductase ArsC [Thermodesulfobacteriota bacterium]